MDTNAHSTVSSSFWEEHGDMARKRLQQKGDLYQQGGWWKLRWKEDQRNNDGSIKYAWSKPVFIGPATGKGAFTEKQARRLAWENFLSRLDQNNRTPQSIATVQEFVERKFLPEHVAILKKAGQVHYGKRNEKTGEYNGMLAHIMPALGQIRLREVGYEDVQRLVSGLIITRTRKLGDSLLKTQHPASTQTRQHVRNAVSAIFTHAEKVQWWSGVNPARHVAIGEMVRKEPHALSFDQAQALLLALTEPVRTMVLCAIVTSMNVAELCGLQWKRVNICPEWIIVDGEAIPPFHIAVRRQFRLGEPTTLKQGSRKRNVALPAPLAESLAVLKQRPQFSGPDDPVFASRNGTPLDQHNISNRVFKRVGSKL